jgi:RNA polymerase sigma factor (sigma-70 family)
MPDGSVTDLVDRARNGDQSAWNELVERYSRLLWSVARAHRLPRAEAADVVQMTWLLLVENLDHIRDPERLPGWLATTARRECLRTLRLSNRERPSEPDDSYWDAPDEDAEPLDARLLVEERDAVLWGCFKRLPGRCQALLRVLMATAPPSYAEVSAAMDLPIGSIGPTRGRCLGRLRELVAEAGLVVVGTDAEFQERGLT